MNSQKIVLFTYYWPPAGGPGVQRWLKLTKYLAEMGWKITIICPKNPTAAGYDYELLKDIHPEIEIIKTQTFEPFEYYQKLKCGKSGGVGGIGIQESKGKIQKAALWIRANLFVPDARKGWGKFAFKAFKNWVVQKGVPDYIITTGPPHSIHLTGLKIKQKFDVKWIADFRDPWTTVFYNEFLPRTNCTKAKDLELETQVLKRANLVTTISPGLKSELENRAGKVEIVWNGFDEKDIPKIYEGKTDKFKISYIGNFKPNQNVPELWRALQSISKELEDFSENLEIELAGNVSDLILNDIEKNGLRKNLELKGYVSHTDATQLMTKSNLLLFVIPQTERNHLILTGKIFEYLASGSQILSIGPPQGDAAEIIRLANRSEMIAYDDFETIKEEIKNAYLSWKNKSKRSTKFETQSVLRFTRKSQAELLNSLLMNKDLE